MTWFIAQPISKDYGSVYMGPFAVSLVIICLMYKAYLNYAARTYIPAKAAALTLTGKGREGREGVLPL